MNALALISALLGVVIISGCVSSFNPEQLAMIKQFMDENPGATVKTVYMNALQVQEKLEGIKETCSDIPVRPYYKIDVLSDKFSMLAYADESGKVVCSVMKSATAGGPPVAPEQTTSVPFVTLTDIPAKIFDPLFTQNGTRVIARLINNEEDWRKLYENDTYMPKIDFARDMVIAASMGMKNTGGYIIKITDVIERQDSLQVDVLERYPAPEEQVTMSLTMPKHVIKLQRSDKPVIFNTVIQTGGEFPATGYPSLSSIKINIAESFPVQVYATIEGTYRGTCTKINDVEERREDNTFFITLATSQDDTKGRGYQCTADTTVPFTKTVALGVHGLKAGKYTVYAVNNETKLKAEFTLDADNIITTILTNITIDNTTMKTITVTSPNGGESWAVGTQKLVTWKTSGVDPDETIHISIVDEKPQKPWLTAGTSYLIATSANSGSYLWDIPKRIELSSSYYLPLENGTFRIKTSIGYGNSTVTSDVSDMQFYISSPPNTDTGVSPSITVLSPNGGEKLTVGETYTIRWQAVKTDKVGLSLMTYDGYDKGLALWIAQANASDGMYLWKVPSTSFPEQVSIPGNKFKILVNSNETLDISDGFFAIENAPVYQKLLTDVKVNGVDYPSPVAYNSTFTVSWTSTGAVSCSAYGEFIPLVGGGLWTDLDNVPASGNRTLYARHQTLGYRSNMQIGMQCYDASMNSSADSVTLPVNPPVETRRTSFSQDAVTLSGINSSATITVQATELPK
ncbi:MAG: protease complex subunit PrcB family protein, partial [Candidatus Aenigmarchaeota archaeon]|nr:protease complex subunit PrcB family protein [Candidatus Aenigmarchaeota archaeon]